MNLTTKKMSKMTWVLLMVAFFLGVTSCKSKTGEAGVKEETVNQKIGVLLVNHGSRSETWRKALFAFEDEVKDQIMADGTVKGVKTAHMEYTEPSIASRMKEFDKEGYTDVIVVPIFLTVSPHPFEDIPTIIGKKENPGSVQELRLEKIERYKPKARTYITPLLDFTNALEKNILRRAQALSKNPEKEGIVLIGYGDVTYDKEWGILFSDVAKYTLKEMGVGTYSYGWCGHIVHYDPLETTKAIEKVLKEKETAIVIPVLVAMDEEFQKRIITDGIKKVKDHKTRVMYKPDAILPDPDIKNWVIDVTKDYAKKVKEGSLSDKL